jgi:P27 family predicted phage terminase small subunit
VARIPKPPGQSQGHRKGPALEVVRAQPPEEPAAFLCPAPPPGLLKSSREHWEAFWRSPIAQAVEADADGYALQRWIEAVDERDRVRRVLKRSRLVEGSQGQPVLNPLATYLANLVREIALAETAFGMTPMSRLRLGIAIGQARMTAAELNRRIAKGAASDRDRDQVDVELDAEYEEA